MSNLGWRLTYLFFECIKPLIFWISDLHIHVHQSDINGHTGSPILGYIALFAIQYFAIQGLVIGVIYWLTSGLDNLIAGKTQRFQFFTLLISGCFVWYLINLLWLTLFDYNLPLLAWILSAVFQLNHIRREKFVLTELSIDMIWTEIISIVLTTLIVLIFIDFNWY